MRLKRKDSLTPSIFADLIIETVDGTTLIDVESPGWATEYSDVIQSATRMGLVMRGETQPRVWTQGKKLRYISRVIGNIDDNGHRRIRVAGLIEDGFGVWLHRDGLVEVRAEPNFRMM